jgi:iron complex outermembrane receptor protein
MNYKNQLVVTGQLNDVGEAIHVNIPKSYRTGIELEGAVKFFSKLQWSANASFSANKISNYRQFVDDFDLEEQTSFEYRNTDIAFSPNIIAASTLAFVPLKDFTISLVSKYVGEQFLDNTSNNTRKLDDFFVNDFRVNYMFKTKLVKEIGLNLLVNNIFNVLYEPNGYTYGYIYEGVRTDENFYYPQAGTNFLASVNLRF